MKVDIKIPVVKDVHVAIVREWDKDFTAREWFSYLINNTDEPLETAIILTRGKSEDGRKTSNLRHAFPVVPARGARKIEMMMPEIFGFTNEFIVSFFKGDTLYDKTFTALPHTISEDQLGEIPVLDEDGVLLG